MKTSQKNTLLAQLMHAHSQLHQQGTIKMHPIKCWNCNLGLDSVQTLHQGHQHWNNLLSVETEILNGALKLSSQAFEVHLEIHE